VNKNLFKYVLIAMPILFSGQLLAYDETVKLDQIIVTDVPTSEVLTIRTDPRNPRQPLPANDGADYLKSIPGFNVMRKGGTDGEPIFRGMAGSRLNILVDGQTVLGGCSMRMDSPTSYIFPEAYDELLVTKGPQTVLYGPGASSGSIMFNHGINFLKNTNYSGRASILGGSFGRNDEIIDIKTGNDKFYIKGIATNSRSGNYEDGNGNKVHSKYHRYSANGAIGFAADENTSLELSGAFSDGEAAYADRGMDGSQFERTNYAIRFEKNKISTLISKFSAQLSHNEVDHIMDDYSLRPAGSMGWARLTHNSTSGKISATLLPVFNLDLNIGIDFQNAKHEKASSMMNRDPNSVALAKDSNFRQIGFFAEPHYFINEKNRVIAGYRYDNWNAKDYRGSLVSDTSGAKRNDSLNSGFIRYENDLSNSPTTIYAGFGYTERFPDYWEIISSHRTGTDNTKSAFLNTKPEKTTQLDFGFLSRLGSLNLSTSVFYNNIDDFILIDYRSGYVGDMGYGSSRNINAYTYGAELDTNYKFDDNWRSSASLAYVRGYNETDHLALAQLPPLEGKLALNWDNKKWFAGGLVRLVNEQNHYSTGQGNIAGKDIGRSGGFSTTSIHAGYRPTDNSFISAGVDNLFDKNYAEFISRSGSSVTGFTTTTRVNEPGRMIWLKGTINF